MIDYNEIRRRAGLKEAEQEILPPGEDSFGDDMPTPEEALQDQIRDLEMAQTREIENKLQHLGFDAGQDGDTIVDVTFYEKQRHVEYRIDFDDPHDLTMAVMIQMMQMGLVSNETSISGTRTGGVWLETIIPAEQSVFKGFLTPQMNQIR